jgi:hypothetical protein
MRNLFVAVSLKDLDRIGIVFFNDFQQVLCPCAFNGMDFQQSSSSCLI